MPGCDPKYAFPSEQAWEKHLLLKHQKVVCGTCKEGRLVFQQEQRKYDKRHFQKHIEYGDPGSEAQAEILAHPWCDFCEKYFFNDTLFFSHLGREHLTCNLCDEFYKNVYYENYLNLENHFA